MVPVTFFVLPPAEAIDTGKRLPSAARDRARQARSDSATALVAEAGASEIGTHMHACPGMHVPTHTYTYMFQVTESM